MFEIFLPTLIAMMIGVVPDASSVSSADTTVEATTTETAVREPEPQIATGKFTTAIEVKPILGMTKSNWVGVRLYDGNDLLYFTHLMAWRCGLWEIRYGVNGEPATNVVPMEPCYLDTASPAAMTDIENYLPYVTLPAESVESVYVEILYDDGTTDFARFNRNEILIP